MKRQAVFAVLVSFLLILFQAGSCLAQSGDDIQTLKKEIETLKEGQKSIQKDLDELKKLLQARQRPPARPEFKETVIDIDDAPAKGQKDAKLVMIEFSDYQ
jgi:Tfp pilus assembly protein PilN